MVKLLLGHGADPNRGIPYGNMTPWEYLLWEAQDDSSRSGLDPWLEIVPLFLACGADPRAITNPLFRRRKSSRVGSRTYQVGDALCDFLQSTNDKKWFGWVWSLSPRCEFSVTEIEIIKQHAKARIVPPIPEGLHGLIEYPRREYNVDDMI